MKCKKGGKRETLKEGDPEAEAYLAEEITSFLKKRKEKENFVEIRRKQKKK